MDEEGRVKSVLLDPHVGYVFVMSLLRRRLGVVDAFASVKTPSARRAASVQGVDSHANVGLILIAGDVAPIDKLRVRVSKGLRTANSI